ncbi:DEAD/DEAH box helicase [bacterium]|nr:DEAD/DEAH box helicase [bacterium]
MLEATILTDGSCFFWSRDLDCSQFNSISVNPEESSATIQSIKLWLPQHKTPGTGTLELYSELTVSTITGLVINPEELINSGLPTTLAGFKLAPSANFIFSLLELTIQTISEGHFLPEYKTGYSTQWKTDPEITTALLRQIDLNDLPLSLFAQSAEAVTHFSDSAISIFNGAFSSILDRIIRDLSHSRLENTTTTLHQYIDPKYRSKNYLPAGLGATVSGVIRDDIRVIFFLEAPAKNQKLWSLKPGIAHPNALPCYFGKNNRELVEILTAFFNNDWNEFDQYISQQILSAQQIFSPLSQMLVSTVPQAITLSEAEVIDFVTRALVELERNGFAIEIPKTLAQNALRPEIVVNIQAPEELNNLKLTGRSKDLFDFSWKIALGETEMSPQEFRELVKENERLLYVNDRWFLLPGSQFLNSEAQLQKRFQDPNTDLLELLKLSLGNEQLDPLLGGIRLSTRSWLEKLIDGNLQLSAVDEPGNFVGSLREYQKQGLGWLYSLYKLQIGACLADDMGLGKTIQFLALIAMTQKDRKGPVLLVVPMSILENWRREAAKFTPESKLYVHHGQQRLTGATLLKRINAIDIVLTTYAMAVREEDQLSKIGWSIIALDEAQNIKNISTKQTKAIRRIAETSKATNRLALTGTPLENRLEELWSIMDFLNPGYLGTKRQFSSRFVNPIEKSKDQKSTETLARLIKPFLLRRLKSDPRVIQDLPEKILIPVYTSLTTEQAALYQSILRQELSELQGKAGIERKGIILRTITRLKQVCDHPALLTGSQKTLRARSGKMELLLELLETILEENDSALIFTQYVSMGKLLKQTLEETFKIKVAFLHGELSRTERQKIVDNFQQSTEPQLLILSLKVGGIGLNLTKANQVIHFDQWWNPAVEDQATDRAFRIGQSKTVYVRKLISRGTLEESIADRLEEKRKLTASIVSTSSDFLTELSDDELVDLLQLSDSVEQFDSKEVLSDI